mgnify:CR=1 FL=1
MKTKTIIVIGILASFSLLAWHSSAYAATLFLAPPSSEIAIGEKLIIDLKIDSEGVSFNAAQAVLRFPKDTLEVVSLDKTDSAFSFWLEEPNFSNTDGVISFIGGTPYGVSGGSIQVLKIVFNAKGNGSGIVTLSDAAITASDGSGTNILSKTVDAAFAILAKKETPPVPVPAPTQEIIPEPIPIIRKPVPTGKLPIKPELKVPLYSDETKWSNLTSQFNVSWDLPLDVLGVSTALNKQPGFLPEKSEGLFDNKTFSALEDGIWYLHVRFQNNVGRGPAAHYRFAVDTQPPLGFEINVVEGETSDNPTPTLQFKTSDALSGLKEYQMRVGDGDPIKIAASDFKGTFQLPLQSPGKRQIVIKAVDWAENSVENTIELDILPIASPIITFVTQELFSEEEKGLTVKGSALPNVNVLLSIQSKKSAIIARGVAKSDEKGTWEFTFDQHLKNGSYVVTAQSQDNRGALSLVAASPEVQVKSKPIIHIGKFQLGTGGAAILLLLLLVTGFGGGVWFYKKRQEKLTIRVLFAESEVSKIFKLIMDDVEGLTKAHQTLTTADDDYALGRFRENIKKMESYLKRGIEKIKK